MIASRKSLRHHFRADKEPPMIGPGIEGDYFDNQNEEFLMQKLNVVQRYYPKRGKGQNQKITTPPPLLPKFKSGYQSESTVDTSEMDDEDSEKFLYSLFTEKDKQEKEQKQVYEAEGLVKTMNNDGNIDGNINRDTDRNVNRKNTNQHHEIMNTTTVWEQRPNEEAFSSVNKSQLQSSSYHPQKVLLEAQLPRPHKSPNCSSASIGKFWMNSLYFQFDTYMKDGILNNFYFHFNSQNSFQFFFHLYTNRYRSRRWIRND
jgi:hypothetical protein